MGEWYLAYCKARQEDLAEKGLKEQGYDVYLPKLRIRKRRAAGISSVDEPLFPRYLFVGTGSREQSLGAIQYTRGVRKLVRFGHYPLPVATEIIDAIRNREDPVTGYHQLELAGLKPGDPLSIKTGIFAGLSGIFAYRSGKDRVVVLLEILGQLVQAAIPLAELER